MAAEHLRVTEGNARGERLTVETELLLGRAMSAEGRLGDDPVLSRRHARLARDAEGRLTIEDLGSANGTFVNGVQVHAPAVLNVGDVVRIGLTTLQLVEVEVEPAPARRAEGARLAAVADLAVKM